MKQTAILHSRDFHEGLELLRGHCGSARQVLDLAEKEYGDKIPLGTFHESDRLGLLLHMVALNNFLTTSVCKVHTYTLTYTTGGGLTFGWDTEGSSTMFFVRHPSGSFPEGSTLRESLLKGRGWYISDHINLEDVVATPATPPPTVFDGEDVFKEFGREEYADYSQYLEPTRLETLKADPPKKLENLED